MENFDIDVWGANLVGENHEIRFEGSQVPNEHLVLKTAALGVNATGTHIVEVTTMNRNLGEFTTHICTLNDQENSNY